MVGPPEDFAMPIARLMSVYHRTDAELYNMGESRMNAILSTYSAIHKELYETRI